MRTDRKSLELLIENLAGLSIGDTERLARKAIFDDGALLPSDLPAVMQAKYELLNRGGVLSFEYDTAQFADLGGMARLKEWLKQRRPAFDGSAPQLEAPKGVLLLGVQGCGKSVAARAAAGIFGVPLLRLDFGALHNKYIGESERNLRETLATADVDVAVRAVDRRDRERRRDRRRRQRHLAPAARHIPDLAGGEEDEGVRRRDRQRHLGAAAGADPQGRFDEIFFVDLPDTADARRDPAHPRQQALSCSSATPT